MTVWLMAAGAWLHRQRRWVTPLLGVVAAASLAYSVEALIIDGFRAAGEIAVLMLVGLTVSALLAFVMAFDVFAARRFGVVLHVAVLKQSSWRRRHEVEHELLVAHAQEISSHATATELTVVYTKGEGDPVADAAQAMLDSAATGAALMPGAQDLRILAAGDITSLMALAYTLQPALASWRTTLLVDRSHEPGDPFIDLRIPDASLPQGDDDRRVLVLVGDHLNNSAEEAYRAGAGGEVRVVRAGDLKESRNDYELVMQRTANELATRRTATLGVGGPAVFGFASGWLAAVGGAGALKPLTYAHDTYVAGPQVLPAGGEPIRQVPSLGIGRRLLLASAMLAAASTLAFGSIATLIEWLFARSNDDGPFADWVLLVGMGIVAPGVLAWFVLRPWADKLSRPDVRVVMQPTDEVSTRETLLVAPRTTNEDPYSCVGWLREAMADIRSFRPGSRVVIDLNHVPSALLRPLGSYLNRGHRGGGVVLRCGDAHYDLTGGGTDEPEAVREVRDGYRNSLRYAEQWEAQS